MSERFKPGDTAYLEVEIAKEHEDGAVALVLPDGQRYLIGLGDAKALNRVVTDCGRDVEFKYIQGRADGLAEGQKKGYDAGYADGLKTAWEAARKIANETPNGGLKFSELEEIFETGDSDTIIVGLSAAEAVAKIKAWEESKKIHVGDVVHMIGSENIHGITTHHERTEDDWHVVWSDGSTGVWNTSKLKKTGRSIDVAGFLKQIGGAT